MATQAPTATATTTAGPTLTLTPPAPVAVIAPEASSGLVPVDDATKTKLEANVDKFISELIAEDAASPAFGAKVDQLTNLGAREIAEAAGQSNRFLDRPVRAMDRDTGIGANLTELRATIEDLDPGKKGDLLSKEKLFGLIPFGGSKLRGYFDSYKSAQSNISAILSRLASGKDELLHDNAAVDLERANLWKTMGKLEQMIHVSKTLDAKIEAKAAELDYSEPAKAKALRESALFYIRQRTTDLLTQMAVSVQGYLALDLVKKNNVELVKGVDRASTTTVAALRTAVTGGPSPHCSEARARTDHRAQHDDGGDDRLDRRVAQDADRHHPPAGRQLDDPHRDTPAGVPEYLYDDGRHRQFQAPGTRFDEDDGQRADQRGREVARLHRTRRRGVEQGARGRDAGVRGAGGLRWRATSPARCGASTRSWTGCRVERRRAASACGASSAP